MGRTREYAPDDAASPRMGEVAFFDALSPAELARLAGSSRRRALGPGEVLVRQGDPGGALFVVVSGRLEVIATAADAVARPVAVVGPGETVGEMALLFDTRRAATVRAIEAAAVVEVDAAAAREALRSSPALRERLWGILAERLPRLRAATLSLFRDLEPAALDALRAELAWVRVPGGGHLYRAGDPADALYVVGSGRLRVVGPHRDRSDGAAGDDLGPGALVGEPALFRDGTRDETVRAVRDSEVVRLDRAGFDRVVARHPAVARVFMRAVVERAERLAIDDAGRPAAVTTVAILGLTRGARVRAFAEHLAEAFRAVGSTAVLDATRVDASVGDGAARGGPGHPLAGWLAEWIAQQERHHAHVLFVGSETPDAWTERCLRQADHVLVLADGAAELVDGRVDALLRRIASERGDAAPTAELVLLDADPERPATRAGQWLEGRTFAGHHHVRPQEHEDLARLVRFLTGRAVGVALGGGGARGVAHLGLLAALEHAGVPVDVVAGTSIGAVVGATYARWGEVAAAAQVCRAELVEARPTRTPSLMPLVSVLSDAGIEAGLQRAFGEARIEEMPLRFLAVAASLTHVDTRVFRRGPVWRAVRASLSLPGILPPVLDDGEVLVDGGVLDNLPVDLLRPRCGVVIASAVHGAPETRADPELARMPGPSSLLWNRARGTSVQVPGIAQVIASTIGAAGHRRSQAQLGLADVVFQPPIEGYGLLDFARFDEIAEVGRRHAEAMLPAIEAAVGSRLSAPTLVP